MRDVVVIGAGPVGLVTAALLARHGVACTVLERDAQVHALPRAVHLDDEALRILQAAGASEAAAALGKPVEGMVLLDARDRELLRFRRGQGVHGYPESVMVHQPALEHALRSLLAARALVDLRVGVEATAIEWSPDGGGLTLRDVASGTLSRLTARWVVACDGANGRSRRLAGIGMRQLGPRQRWLVVDALVPGGLPGAAVVEQRCDPRRPSTFMHVVGERYRWEFLALPGETDAALLDQAASLIAGRLGGRRVTVERAAVYEFRARVATTLRAGPLLLAGDAAHEMPPFLGQGLCAGLRDAHNLTWKLALVLRGGAETGLLDTYDAERLPHVREVIRVACRVGRIIADRHPLRASLRSALLRAARPVLDGRVGLSSLRMPDLEPGPLVLGGPATGQHVPQVNGGDGRLDEVLGPGFTLLGEGLDPRACLSAPALAWWRRLGASFARVGPGDQDPGGELVTLDAPALQQWLRTRGIRLAVVRPDRVIAASATGDRLPDGVVRRLSEAGLRPGPGGCGSPPRQT